MRIPLWACALPALLLVILSSSCYRVTNTIEPRLDYHLHPRDLNNLPPPFAPLSTTELQSPWGREYFIGSGFGKELDLYRAITAFKRGEILLGKDLPGRREELAYQTLLSYYLGNRYADVIDTFEQSTLRQATLTLPPYDDLLLILYESYQQEGAVEQAAAMATLLGHSAPAKKARLDLSTALIAGRLEEVPDFTEQLNTAGGSIDSQEIGHTLDLYRANKKSISQAQLLNTLLPGAGYLYVGQKQSAITAFLLNSLFTAAAVHLFIDGNIAGALIVTSLEAGWYFGGIYGAGEAAKFYNDTLYAKQVHPLLVRNRLFPVLMLEYGF